MNRLTERYKIARLIARKVSGTISEEEFAAIKNHCINPVDSREAGEEKAKEKHIEEIIPILKIDSQLSLDEIDKQTVDSLKAIEPFGEENKNPLFLFKNLKIDSIRALTEGKHLKLTVKENKNIVNAIGFNLGTLANEYKIGDKVDIVGNLEMNSFNGVDSIQINIKDIMKSL